MGDLGALSNLSNSDEPRFSTWPPPREAHALRRILVCVDRSKFADACLRLAVAVSEGIGSAITLLHVLQPARERSGLQTTDILDWELSRQEANAFLEGLKKAGTLAAGRQVETRLEQGHPAERIAAIARELDVDLTILGSQGERCVADGNLGSTVQQVLAVAPRSVLIARSSSPTGDASPRHILVPLDGSLRAESVMPTAVRIASAHDAELLLVFVVLEPRPSAVLRSPADLELAAQLASRLEVNGARYLDGLRDRLVREGASVRTLVIRSANERDSLIETARKERSDLVVLSAHGATCSPALTRGSVTAHLLAHLVVPLLVLQDLDDSGPRKPADDRHAPPLRGRYPECV